MMRILRRASSVQRRRLGGGGTCGGADCAASIISNGTKLKHKILDSLEVKLENEGFEKFETTLAGDGVGILWPAVLHNGNEEEGGEEIDQDKFLMAEGTVGIERLVGVAGPRRRLMREVREGWKFWRPWLPHEE